MNNSIIPSVNQNILFDIKAFYLYFFVM